MSKKDNYELLHKYSIFPLQETRLKLLKRRMKNSQVCQVYVKYKTSGLRNLDHLLMKKKLNK